MMIPAGNVQVDLAEHGDMVVHRFKTDGEFETEALQSWTSMLGEGDVAIDVGAYSGLYAIAGSKRGATVHALEPLPSAFNRMLQNLTRNETGAKGKVVTYQRAAGLDHGRKPFVLNGAMHMPSAGTLKQFAPEARTGVRKTIDVDVWRLDHIVHGPVKVIKIDAEGGELEVLKGSTIILGLHKPAIIVELLSEAAEAEVGDWLRGHGYVGQPLDDRNWLFEN